MQGTIWASLLLLVAIAPHPLSDFVDGTALNGATPVLAQEPKKKWDEP